MKMLTHNLGFPRIGAKRELKKALESFWSGKTKEADLLGAARAIRKDNWLLQQSLGIDLIPSNDFSLYDHVLDTCALVGAIPQRFHSHERNVALSTYFAMARGRGGDAEPAGAMEMTKWLDSNYHYLVPELRAGQTFELSSTKPFDEFNEAKALGVQTMPVLLGPVSFLMLAKTDGHFERLSLLPSLLGVYERALKRLSDEGAIWLQLDEPALALDLSGEHLAAFSTAFSRLRAAAPSLKLMLAVYFGGMRDNLAAAVKLPVDAIHIDAVRAPQEIEPVVAALPDTMMLSLGIVDGRNVWKNDFARSLELIGKAERLGERLTLSPSCSLLHVPVSLEAETKLDAEIKGWLAFAGEKLIEVVTLASLAGGQGLPNALKENQSAIASRRQSPRIHNREVKERVRSVGENDLRRDSPYARRREQQRERLPLPLPLLPTTTIGSFPQTEEVRAARARYHKGELTSAEYQSFLEQKTAECVRWQEQVGLDVLVHGEFERNDMVEYFGEQLAGFTFTANGWVQSYGSRCVKPPIIFGDVHRPKAMTVRWSKYASSLTNQAVKGMLTGPITMLQWSFVRDDQPRSEIARQIALAIRDEVLDLEDAAVAVIQIDEPALREGLPLRRADRADYLKWAVDAFRLAASGVRDETQIHTHMCYCEFNDIIDAIAALDADVISIEASRSRMELLDAFVNFNYPNEIGPGVWDIHSPRVPDAEEMLRLINAAARVIPKDRLWVNPDCGLKTRRWEEVKPALANLVAAARRARSQL